MERAKDGMVFDRNEDLEIIDMMVQGTLRHAKSQLLTPFTRQQLEKTVADIWQTLHAIPDSGVIYDGGGVCPGLGVDVCIMKDPKFAGRFREFGGLPNGGSGQYNQDVLRAMADAFRNYLAEEGELIMNRGFGRPGEKSIVFLFEPKDRDVVFDFLETATGGKERIARAAETV